MSTYEDEDQSILSSRDDYYETVASQEEVYVEETEKEVLEVLISDKKDGKRRNDSAEEKVIAANENPHIAQRLNEQLTLAAEELITGDADDPPLSEEAVAEMLSLTRLNVRAGYPGICAPPVVDSCRTVDLKSP